MEWSEAYDKVLPYVVKIETPRLSGTGFLFAYSDLDGTPYCGVATAAHVLSAANKWEEHIRVTHHATGKSVVLREGGRVILPDERRDTVALLFPVGDLALPGELPSLVPEKRYLQVGREMGWVGFPALSPSELCFFHGRVSNWREDREAYLVDGVAINGVSGGPAFVAPGDQLFLAGVVSAYRPNRATGETLPGVSVVQNVAGLHDVVKFLKSLKEAREKAKETTEVQPPTAPPASGQ